MSIMSYSGGTVMAMTGKECICIGTDLRFGEQMTTIATDVKKIHKISDGLYVGLCGFASDALTVLDKLKLRKELYELRESRKVKPKVFASMLSNLCYQRRFGSYFIEPLIAGLDPHTNVPYIADLDHIGALCEPEDFVVVGTAAEFIMGICEGIWKPNMEPEDLFEATAQAMLAGLNRDAASGNGALIYTITKDSVNIRSIRTRMD